MRRKPISETLDVGIKAINTMFTVGRGQRLGIIVKPGSWQINAFRNDD